MPNIQVEVMGVPIPQGSKRAFAHPSTGRVVIVDNSAKALHTYREAIAHGVRQHMEHPLHGNVLLRLDFLFPRPRGHYGKNGLLPSAPKEKTTKPDIDKLVRAVMDALTGVAYMDDAQVTMVIASKMYSDHPATYVLVEWHE